MNVPQPEGLTTNQIRWAPPSSVYIWPVERSLSYPRALAHHLERPDIKFIGLKSVDRLRGELYPIIVDHGVWEHKIPESTWHVIWQAQAAQPRVYIYAAAFFIQNKLVWLKQPARHNDIVADLYHKGHSSTYIATAEQGFLSSKLKFLNRKEALIVAEASGQLIRRTAPHIGLFSEDCW